MSTMGPQRDMNIFIDPRFEAVYQQHPLVLVDVGARGGLKRNWSAAEPHLRLLGFEPDEREFSRLAESARGQEKSKAYFHVALHNRSGPISLHIAQDRGLSSIFEPNRAFLDTFPEADRFDTTDVQQVEADALDNQLRAHNVTDIDFIKADTQGSELFVLQGAREALAASAVGVEVEVEFTPIYTNQPLFADVDTYMRGLGYLLFDLRPCYWKRAVGRAAGGAYGQIIWADALYLKSVPALMAAVATLPAEVRASKALRAISVALLYGYYDYALEIARGSGSVLTSDERAAIEQSIRERGERHDPLARLPGRRQLADALRRMWRRCRLPNEGWSVSDAENGNPD
jgi:FkbM family methyltransferase